MLCLGEPGVSLKRKIWSPVLLDYATNLKLLKNERSRTFRARLGTFYRIEAELCTTCDTKLYDECTMTLKKLENRLSNCVKIKNKVEKLENKILKKHVFLCFFMFELI